MEVHKVISGFVAGFGYENNTLRVVIKTKSGLKAYDYLNVTAEDAGVFCARARQVDKLYKKQIRVQARDC